MNFELQRVQGHNVEACDEVLAKNIADTLHKHFPGYPWAVFVDSEGGIAVIKNFAVSYRYGMVLKYNTLFPFDTEASKKVMLSGGELLERAELARKVATGEYAKQVDGIKNKPDGMII